MRATNFKRFASVLREGTTSAMPSLRKIDPALASEVDFLKFSRRLFNSWGRTVLDLRIHDTGPSKVSGEVGIIQNMIRQPDDKWLIVPHVWTPVGTGSLPPPK
jgi:hypothetical protein